MSDDLIKWLRNTAFNIPRCAEVADLIEQQAAQIAALESTAKSEPVAEVVGSSEICWVRVTSNGLKPGDKLYTAPTAALEKGGGRDAWISVDERLPEERQVVLVFRPDAHLLPACDPNIDCRCYFGNGVFNGIHPVTHWMPLPAPPAALYQKANDGLSLRAQHEDACIAANNNAQDAERYRWLRTLDSDFGNRNRMSEMARFYGETLDEAIDAALSQKAGEQQ